MWRAGCEELVRLTQDRDSSDRSLAALTIVTPSAGGKIGDGRTTRRCFLRVAGTTSLLGAIPACAASGDSAPEPFGDVAAGNVSALDIGALQAISGAPAIIGRDAGGLYAMTATCTHEGCNMLHNGSVRSDGVYCSCHGSLFDANGNPVSGPAHGALAHFAVSVDMTGLITVHGGSAESAAARTPVG